MPYSDCRGSSQKSHENDDQVGSFTMARAPPKHHWMEMRKIIARVVELCDEHFAAGNYKFLEELEKYMEEILKLAHDMEQLHNCRMVP